MIHSGREENDRRMLSQVDERMRKWSNERREELFNKKYLGEIIEEEKPEFGSNNLILAPVGSGKTHLVENLLIPEDFKGKALYLTSNTALKDSLAPEDNEIRKRLASEGNSVGFFTSSNKNRYGGKPYSVHVMTYHEFGSRIKAPYETFTDEFELIFCDEIHSLPKYSTYDNSAELVMALNWILREREGKRIYYFTATSESVDELRKSPGYMTVVKTFDYMKHPNIRKYVANSTYYINHIDQLRPHLRSKLDAFNYYGYKALAFTRLISEQKKIEEIAIGEGFKPLVLWSINNENKMSEEQLKAREFILSTGNIPEPYNFLIINGAMQEGWNLYDDKVTLAILDTLDITEQVQSLGRIRKDIDIVIKKTKDDFNQYSMDIPSSYLNTHLTTSEKRVLCEELYILNKQGVVMMWPTVRGYIAKSGYNIEEKVVTIDGKRTRVSIITIDREDEKSNE